MGICALTCRSIEGFLSVDLYVCVCTYTYMYYRLVGCDCVVLHVHT